MRNIHGVLIGKKSEEAHKLLDAGVDGKTHLKLAFKESQSTVLEGLMFLR
jgi:hypothetical protein